MLFCALLIFAVALVKSVPVVKDDRQNCGYEHCPKTEGDVLNVHIVAHTHDDVGWLKTVDQYYYGSRNNIQKAGVQYILDSVVKELWEDPKRKFIYVETAFFWKWWVRQSDAVQQKVHTLVREGRLQFVGGAWSMNDEAAAHYHSTIDQFTWGLRKINQTFGPCALPRVGWQIDPFGHSREFASLLAGMGYDGLFLGRIDYQDKRTRLARKTMEMVWRGDDDLGKQSDIFTGVLYNTYSPPPGFCFDVLCDDEPIIDDPDSPAFNVDAKISVFIDYVQKMSKSYVSNNVLVTMGGDFTYQDAAMWYTNLDKLIAYTNLKAAKDGLNIKLFYSTPNCYLKAVKDANPSLPSKRDDFFPYASDPHAYWTGYFTSRPTTKYFERRGNVYLQAAKQLQILAGLESHNEFVINGLKSAMGILQHHDAITGTEKQHVTSDYVRILDRAIEDALLVPRQAFNKMMSGNPNAAPIFDFNRCALNESSCEFSENNEKFVVTLYNPVAWHVNVSVRVPVKEGTYQVYAPMGAEIESQLVTIPKQIREIPTRKSEATYEIVFVAYLKPLFYKSFYIKKAAKTKRDVTIVIPKRKDLYENIDEYWNEIKEKNDVEIKNLEFDNDNSQIDVKIPVEPTLIEEVEVKTVNLDILKDKNEDLNEKVRDLERIIKEGTDKVARNRDNVYAYPNLSNDEMRMLSDDPEIVEVSEDYVLMEKDNISLRIDSTTGAIRALQFHNGTTINFTYNFYYYPGSVGDNEKPEARSSGAYIFRPNASQPIELKNEDFEIVNGNVVKEFRTKWSDNAFSVARLYDGLDYLEIDWLIGPIGIEDDVGKEYIIKYETNLVNNGEFHTDSNGRQTLLRKLDSRPQYNYTVEEPIAGNYYPVTNEVFIEDSEDRLTVLTDRSQGATSLIEGEIEIMLHRRLLHDDAFGVGEALNEEIDGKGLVVRGNHRLILSQKSTARKQAIENDLKPLIFVSKTDLSLDNWLGLTNCFSWLKSQLPEGIHLLTLEAWDDKLLLRLENYLDSSKVSDLEVDLTAILLNVKVKGAKEAVLSANEWVGVREKWFWVNDMDAGSKVQGYLDDFKVVIKAKEIKTFIIDFEYYP